MKTRNYTVGTFDRAGVEQFFSRKAGAMKHRLVRREKDRVRKEINSEIERS